MAQRYSIVGRDSVEYTFWLTFAEDGSLAMSRGEPRLATGHRAMALTLKVPRSIFAIPQLRATIAIEDPGTPPLDIDISAAADALRRTLGCAIALTIEEGGACHE